MSTLKFSSTIIALFLSGFIFSQEFAVDVKKESEEVNDNSYNAQWAGMDFGFISTNRSDEWENKMFSSIIFNLNFVEYKLPIYKQYLGLTTGLGMGFREYRFQTDYSLVKNGDISTMEMGNPHLYDTMANVSRSSLNLGYFHLPILLDFATKQRGTRSFYVACGVVGGIRYYGNHSQRGEYSNGDKFNNVIRNKGAFNTNLLTLEATARIGYGQFGLFANYSLNGLFKNGAAPTINPFNVGISLNFDYNDDEPIDGEDVDLDSIEF